MKQSNRRRRRGRGRTDVDIWKALSIVHSSVWGLSFMLFGFSFFGVFQGIYASYIEHGISNLNVLVYVGTIIALTVDGILNNDLQSFLEMSIYSLMFGLGCYLTELMEGVDAIRHLNPEYPYADFTLVPSILYWLGVFEHKKHIVVLPEISSEEPFEPIESDPSAENDIIIDDFSRAWHL